MFGYAATAATATEALLPFEDAPLITNPGGLLEQAVHWAGAGGYLGQGGGTEHAGGLGADGTSCPPAVDRSHRQTRSQRVCR